MGEFWAVFRAIPGEDPRSPGTPNSLPAEAEAARRKHKTKTPGREGQEFTSPERTVGNLGWGGLPRGAAACAETDRRQKTGGEVGG